jgi:hypothetical protein
MKSKLFKVTSLAFILMLLSILLLPIGIHVGTERFGVSQAPVEELAQWPRTNEAAKAYKAEVVCKYFVVNAVREIPVWRYSDNPSPNYPNCDFLTLYWSRF